MPCRLWSTFARGMLLSRLRGGEKPRIRQMPRRVKDILGTRWGYPLLRLRCGRRTEDLRKDDVAGECRRGREVQTSDMAGVTFVVLLRLGRYHLALIYPPGGP